MVQFNIIDKGKNFIDYSKDSLTMMSVDELEQSVQQFVNYNFPKPKNAIVFLNAPHVLHGFANSCSEASAEVILRFWEIKDWNQFRIHREGYQTFEGKISEGDLGILNLFKFETFQTKKGKKIQFNVEDRQKGTLDELKQWLNRGIPLIVRITTDAQKINQHTEVLIGFDQKGVYLNDNDQWADRTNHYWIYRTFEQFLNGWTQKYMAIYPKSLSIK